MRFEHNRTPPFVIIIVAIISIAVSFGVAYYLGSTSPLPVEQHDN